MTILNLDHAPDDPIALIVWLDGVKAQVARELDRHYAEAYFTARTEGRLEDAVRRGSHSRKQAVAYTRKHNNATGRSVRWGDDADPWTQGR